MNVKFGCAPINWTNDDLPSLGSELTYEQCISEMALAGFKGTEVGHKYPKDVPTLKKTSVYKGYKQDKIEMRDDRAEMSDFPLYLNTVAGGLDRRDQTIGGFSFVVKIYAVPVVEIIG